MFPGGESLCDRILRRIASNVWVRAARRLGGRCADTVSCAEQRQSYRQPCSSQTEIEQGRSVVKHPVPEEPYPGASRCRSMQARVRCSPHGAEQQCHHCADRPIAQPTRVEPEDRGAKKPCPDQCGKDYPKQYKNDGASADGSGSHEQTHDFVLTSSNSAGLAFRRFVGVKLPVQPLYVSR